MKSQVKRLINPETGNCTWYRTIHKDRLDEVLTKGFETLGEDSDLPFICGEFIFFISLTTKPKNTKWGTVLEVDLSDMLIQDGGWYYEDVIKKPKDEWRLMVFREIPPEKIKPYN